MSKSANIFHRNKGAQRIKDTFVQLEHANPQWVCPSFLEKSGIKDEVKHMMRRSGWSEFFSLVCEDDIEDSSMFLGSFEDHHDAEEPYISYEHRGMRRTTSYKELRRVMKWPSNGIYRDGAMNMETEAWMALTRSTKSFIPSKSKATEIVEPALFYLKYMLARTIFARDNGKDKVKRIELGALSLLQDNQRVDWAAYFTEHVKTVSTDGVVCCGGFITLVLRRLHPEFSSEDRLVKDWKYATDSDFESGKIIRYRQTGEVCWIYFADKSLVPPKSPVRRGRPTKRREASSSGSRSLVGIEGADANRGDEGGMSQEVINDIFHNTRCYMFGALNITRLPAPPGWKPGDAIPPDYMR